MKRMHKRSLADHNARLLNLFALCHGAIFALPVLLPYYRDQIGLGFKELMVGEALFATMIILSEVPTGWLADHWKRKFCLALAGVTGMGGWCLLLMADTFLHTVIAQGTLGVSISLVSGTLSALHYDSLLAENRVDEYRKQEGRRHGLGMLSVGLSALLGGFLYKISPQLPLMCTILAGFGMASIAMLMIEPPRFQVAGHKNPFVVMGQTLRYALHGHKEIAEIIFVSAALFSATKMMMWSQQAYYTSIHLDERWFGILMAAGFLLGSAASHLGHLFDHRFNNRTVLLAMTISVVALCASSAILGNIYGAVLLLAGSLFWGIGWPRVQDAINKRADSHHRATVLSTASMMIHLLSIPLSLMLGWVTDHQGIEMAVLCLCLIPGLAALVLLRMVTRKSVTA